MCIRRCNNLAIIGRSTPAFLAANTDHTIHLSQRGCPRRMLFKRVTHCHYRAIRHWKDMKSYCLRPCHYLSCTINVVQLPAYAFSFHSKLAKQRQLKPIEKSTVEIAVFGGVRYSDWNHASVVTLLRWFHSRHPSLYYIVHSYFLFRLCCLFASDATGCVCAFSFSITSVRYLSDDFLAALTKPTICANFPPSLGGGSGPWSCIPE